MKLLSKQQNSLGEGACYDRANGMFYWVDIPEKRFWRLSPAGEVRSYDLPIMPGFIALAGEGRLIIGGNDRLLLWKDEILQSKPIGCDATRVRINDGSPHPSGKFILFGTCHLPETEPQGTAYRLTDRPEFYRGGFTVFNGPAFSPAGDKVYFADSPARIIYCAAVDVDSETIAEADIFAEISETQGYPDGMAIDSEGCLWNAHWDGAMITRYRPNGTIAEQFDMPVKRPTSIAFIGEQLKTVAVTSAACHPPGTPKPEAQADKIQDGDLLSFKSSVGGVAVASYEGGFFA